MLGALPEPVLPNTAGAEIASDVSTAPHPGHGREARPVLSVGRTPHADTSGGSFAKAGLVEALYVGECIGLMLIWAGYWVISRRKEAAVPVTAEAQTA